MSGSGPGRAVKGKETRTASHDNKDQRPADRHDLRNLRFPDVLTLLGVFSGIMAILYAIDGEPAIASIMIIVAIIFDGLDGAVARRMGVSDEFGVRLDSINDLISFGFAPAVLLYTIYYDTARGPSYVIFQDGANWENGMNGLTVLVATLMILLAAVRLARYMSSGTELGWFEGMPTTASAYGVAVLVSVQLHLEELGEGAAVNHFAGDMVLLGALGLAVLMLSSIPYPKLRRESAIIALTGLSVTLFCFALLLAGSDGYIYPFYAGCGLFLVYLAGGPLMAKKGPLLA